jgi:two-component system, NtrC family, sensor kinase
MGDMANSAAKPLKQPYYRSLTRNMVLIIMIVTLTPGILVMGVILRQFSESYNEKVFSHLQELVSKHKQNINNFLNEKLADIQLIVTNVDFATLSDDKQLETLLQTVQIQFNHVFVDFGLVDDEGIQVAYAGPFKLVKAHYADADWFKKAIVSEYYISDVFLGLRGHPHFIVAVRHQWKNRRYILRATIDFKAFNTVVENLRVGKTGAAFIVNHKGEFQTRVPDHVEVDEIGYQSFFNNVELMKNRVQYLEHKNAAGEKFIYLGALLKGGDWLLIFRQNFDDALADLTRLQKIIIIISLLGGVAIMAMSYLLSRRMVNRIALADREKEMMNQQVIETGKLASIGELAAGIAHEINNPVAIMVEEAGWIQDILAEEEFKKSENLGELDRALKQINTQGKRCKEITHKLLSFARKTDPRIQDVDVNMLIREIVGLSAQRAKYANVEISLNLVDNLPPIKISQSEMQQVLLNMINNALDALGNRGGKLDIITTMEDDGFISIAFADNGPGIHPDHLARIFDPFFTTKPVGKGTGLGLSICYGIINKTGGNIDVKSALGIGTTFKIRMPVHDKKEA